MAGVLLIRKYFRTLSHVGHPLRWAETRCFHGNVITGSEANAGAEAAQEAC